MKDKTNKKAFGYWKQFAVIMRKTRIPWIMVILSFIISFANNEILLNIPDTTAALMSGDLSNEALFNAILFYVLFAVVICTRTTLLVLTKCLATRNARGCLWRKMLNIRVKYYDKNDPDELMSAVTNDLGSAMPKLVDLCITVIPDIWFLVKATIHVADYNFFLLLSILIILPFKYGYMIFIGKKGYKVNLKIYTEIGKLTGFLAERISNLPLIKSFTKEEAELKNGEEAVKKLYHANMSEYKLSVLAEAIQTAITLAQQFAILITAVILLQNGSITMPQWVAFFLFSENIIMVIDTLVSDWMFAKDTQGIIARTAEMLMAEEENTEEKEASDTSEAVGDIEFDHVSFAYGEKQALNDVSFTAPQGSMTAIVGLCGSGKTTSLSLLERFYRPDQGQIRLGGNPIEDMSLSEYRRHFAYVQQNPQVFSGTVREAVTYGIRREISDEEIRKASDLSGLSDYINKQALGLDTPVSAGGSSLSGGQRQRMVLTREFLRNSDILLLDEPTSALDANTAKAVQKAIVTLFKGKTVIIVTHDMNLLEGMDRIIVLENSRLAGSGSYEELMGTCDLFREMIETQKNSEGVPA